MGIYSRDYVRESSRRSGGWGDDIPACKWLIITTAVVFVLQLVTARDGGSFVEDWFALEPEIVRNGQLWRLVTYAFLHSQHDLLHLVFNMLGLWWFGSEIERLYGSREFTVFYLASAIVAGIGFVVWQLAMGLPQGVVGASGAVLAVLTLYATHYPREKIYIYGIIPVEIRWILAMYVALDLWPVLRALNGDLPRSHIAHAAHLLGMAFGWLYRHYHWHLSGWFDPSQFVAWFRSLPRRRRQAEVKKKLRVFDPEPEPEPDLEGELDRILAKIHEHGSDSLSDRERAILTQASQQFKNRQ